MPSSKFNKLHGARIVVLGGTSGIGFAVAEGALEYNASVVLASSSATKVEAAVAKLRATFPDREALVSGRVCDLSEAATLEANLTALLQFATNDGKKIDHIVNTAGGPGRPPPLPELSTASLTRYDLKPASLLMLGKVAPAFMEPGPQASLITTTGTLLYKPQKGLVTGLGWGGSIDSMARALAVDLAPLRVNVVSPGAIDTELLQSYGGGSADALKAVYQQFRDTNLLKLVASPEDTAEAYLYLMKDRFITAQVIHTDGGRMFV